MWSPFGPFRSSKYLNFGQKLPIRTTIILFWKVITLKSLKIYIMFCPSREAKKRYQLMGYLKSWKISVLFENVFLFPAYIYIYIYLNIYRTHDLVLSMGTLEPLTG